MKKQKKFIVIVLALLLLSAVGLGVLLKMKNNTATEPETEVIIEETIEENKEPDYSSEIQLWEDNHALNEDYVGQITFESGLIDLPFVQSDDNETYFRTDWATMKHDEEGSVFMDYRCEIGISQNIILYGHNVEVSYEPSKTHKFTPLHVLEDKEKLEENKYIDLLLEDEIQRYEIVAIYYCEIYEEDGTQYVLDGQPAYYYTDFTEEEFAEFIELVKENSYYDTGVEVGYEDSLLTLQTCTSGTIDKFLILAKLIETTYIR